MTIEATTTDGLWMENITYDELSVGHSARLVRTVTLQDIQAFAAVSGDINPAHLNPEYADATMFHGVIAHGMLGAALISALFGTQFPGPGTIYLGQELKFTKPVRIGDTLTVLATVSEKNDEKKRIKMDCLVTNQSGETVLKGEANLMPPTKKVRVQRIDAPQIQLYDPEARFSTLLDQVQGLDIVRCAVVHPLRCRLAVWRDGCGQPRLDQAGADWPRGPHSPRGRRSGHQLARGGNYLGGAQPRSR